MGPLIGAVVMHESLHALGALCCGLIPRFDIDSRPAIRYEVPADWPRVEIVIGALPMLAGAVIAAMFVAERGLPPQTQAGVIWTAAWFVLSTPSLEDIGASTELWYQHPRHWRWLVAGTAFWLVGMAGREAVYIIGLDGLPFIAWVQLTVGLAIGGMLTIFASAADYGGAGVLDVPWRDSAG
jgi:hypothetical protein